MTPEPASFVSIAANLGVAGFSIWIMWKMFDSNTQERSKNEEHIRGLEREVRDKIIEQLHHNTRQLEENSKIMQQMLDHVNQHH